MNRPFRLEPDLRERIWGRQTLAPYHLDAIIERPIGEIWFTHEGNGTSLGPKLGELLREFPEMLGDAALPSHPGVCPLLVKLLFTSSRLSVQVHPDDNYASEHHQSLGKTEAWYVLNAEPPAEVAVGFREAITPERLSESAKSGEIEELLDWRKVKAGDVVFVPAGTVHAIGAGLTICEIQQNSDVTYRLYDYGRPRELHLDHGCRVSNVGPYRYNSEPKALAPWRDNLVSCRYFHIERLQPSAPIRIEGNLPHYLLLICAKGSGSINGEPFNLGETWMVPAKGHSCVLEGRDSEWILAYAADQPMTALAEI